MNDRDGRVYQVNVSPGGVPKLPVDAARVDRFGLAGDRHADETSHGGPLRAVSLFALEAIERVQADGHPIEPGSVGENLTTTGIELSTLPIGSRLRIGERLLLELSAPDGPCSTIRASFRDGRFARISIRQHPTDSRMYARVLEPGEVRTGDPIRVLPPDPDRRADDLLLLTRIDTVERASALAAWRAARAAGVDVRIVEHGELAFGAAPGLPGPAFNTAHGLTDLPNLLDRATGFFTEHGTAGWLFMTEPPWPAARPDFTLIVLATTADAIAEDRATVDGVVTRRLASDEAGAWARLLVDPADDRREAAAWAALAPGLARTPHVELWVAELGGAAVGAGALVTRRGVGHLRAAAVAPAHRGHGIQRALIAARARSAIEAGCDVISATAPPGSASERNLRRMGFRAVGERAAYRYEPTAPD